jgi:hypothetical protein
MMKKYINRFTLFFSCVIVIISCCSWGFYAHETATQLAVYKLPKQVRRFFFSDIDSITPNSIRPDERRSTDKTEGPKHFIDIENYGAGAMLTMPHDLKTALEKYSWDTLKKYGYVPYQVLIEYDSLVNALKHNNADSIIFYAVDLAHYIEDANVPLHTTNNYDGQLTGQKGLHALWESTIPELELSSYNLYTKHKATYVTDKTETIWTAVRRAHALLPEMFEKEKEVAANFPDSSKYEERMYYGRKAKVYTDAFARKYAAALTTTINDQLNFSANMVADFWYTAWVDAGKPNMKSQYKFQRSERKKLCKELKAYKRNDLIKDSLLRARKE